jgi:hypothetical protein
VLFLWCMVQGLLPTAIARNLGVITRRMLLDRRSGPT